MLNIINERIKQGYRTMAYPAGEMPQLPDRYRGGPFVDHDEKSNGCDSIVPVDMYIPSCPPHPLTILDGILRLLGRIESPQR